MRRKDCARVKVKVEIQGRKWEVTSDIWKVQNGECEVKWEVERGKEKKGSPRGGAAGKLLLAAPCIFVGCSIWVCALPCSSAGASVTFPEAATASSQRVRRGPSRATPGGSFSSVVNRSSPGWQGSSSGNRQREDGASDATPSLSRWQGP